MFMGMANGRFPFGHNGEAESSLSPSAKKQSANGKFRSRSLYYAIFLIKQRGN